MTEEIQIDSPRVNNRHSSVTDDWGTPIEVIEAARETMGSIDLDPASSTRHNHRVRAKVFFGPEGGLVSNGFTTRWAGKVFLNPPGGRCDANGNRVTKDCNRTGACGHPSHRANATSLALGGGEVAPFIHKAPIVSAAKAWWWLLAREWFEKRAEMAIFVGFSLEVLQTTQVRESWVDPRCSIPLDFPLCIPSRRLAFVGEEGEPIQGMTHASVIVFVPPSAWAQQDKHIQRFERAFSTVGRCR